MKTQRHWKITIKERNNPNLLTPELIGDYDEKDAVKHFGLNEQDVEWYRLEEIK